MRRQCEKAAAVCYVTGNFLQRRYPPNRNALSTSFINMELGEDAFVGRSTRTVRKTDLVRIVTVGALEQPYKAVDVLIDAIRVCIGKKQKIELTVIGDGRCKQDLERHARARGMTDTVKFLGTVASGKPVRDELDSADLFVLASRTEGLPRALIEAMARGLPCIGSSVGGIPELLPADDLVPPGNAIALANKIMEVVNNVERMERMSTRNLERARDYVDSVLDAKRQVFLVYLQNLTLTWCQGTRICPPGIGGQLVEQSETSGWYEKNADTKDALSRGSEAVAPTALNSLGMPPAHAGR
jgi:glycosyltransferase involved in cell wall biosynthesis